MDNKGFSAFISYRHGDRDSKVAKAVQNGIEHYRIPNAIKIKTGIKKLNRVFRDQSELSADADLPEQIKDALDNADYLIVICSSRTKESIWVPQEISYFLEHHDMKKVTTVLSEGEPYEVIPDLLLGEHEPISADYRKWRNGSNKAELMRLIAPILGVKYDELSRRQQQYERRKLTCIIAGIVAITSVAIGYLSYSRNAIKKNYNNALINQSVYLSQSSQEALNTMGDRVLATQLALKALPEQGNDRPIISEALYALQKSTGAYVMKDDMPRATWTYQMPGAIRYFDVKDDYACAFDNLGNISIWNVGDHSIINSLNDSSVKTIALTKHGLIIVNAQSVRCVSIEDFKEKWNFDNIGYELKLTEEGDSFYLYPNDYLAKTHTDISLYDTETGNGVKKYSLDEFEKYIENIRVFCSDEGNYVAYNYAVHSKSTYDFYDYIIIENLMNHEQIEMDLVPAFEDETVNVYFRDKQVYFVRSRGEGAITFDGYYNTASNSSSKYAMFDGNLDVYAFDIATGEKIWENEGFKTQRNASPILFGEPNNSEIVVAWGSKCYKLDARTGKELDSVELEDTIVDYWIEDNEDKIVLKNGSFGTVLWHDQGDEEACVGLTEKVYPTGIDRMKRFTTKHKECAAIIQKSEQPYLLQFEMGVYDKSFVGLEKMATDEKKQIYKYSYILNDRYLVYLEQIDLDSEENEDQGNRYILNVCDTNLKDNVKESEIIHCSSCRLLGASNDNRYAIIAVRDTQSYILKVLLADPTKNEKVYIDNMLHSLYLGDDMIIGMGISLVNDLGDIGGEIIEWDLNGNIVYEHKLNLTTYDANYSVHYMADLKKFVVSDYNVVNDYDALMQLGYASVDEYMAGLEYVYETQDIPYEIYDGLKKQYQGLTKKDDKTDEPYVVAESESQGVFSFDNKEYKGYCVLVDVDSGSITEISGLPDREEKYEFCGNDEDLIVLGCTGEVVVINVDGQVKVICNCTGSYPRSATIYGENIFVLCEDTNNDGQGGLYKFSKETGEMVDYLKIDELDDFTQEYENLYIKKGYLSADAIDSWKIIDDMIYIRFRCSLYVIDLERWKLRSVIHDCLGMDSNKKFVFAFSDISKEVGYFQLYSTEDLMNKALGFLGEDNRMSDQNMLRYGISDK